MYQLRIIGTPPPQHLRKDPIYGIISRNTLMGFHRAINTTSVDKDCSKSYLWFASQRSIVEHMVEKTTGDMQKGISYQAVDENRFLRYERAASLMPLRIEEFTLDDLEKLCNVHHFDMYIATELKSEDEFFIMEGYEYITHEWPNRNVVERYMRDMLYKNN